MVQEISSEMNYVYYPSTNSIIWSMYEPANTFSIVFDYREEETDFTTTMTSCIYESQLHVDFSKLSIIDQNKIIDSTVVNEEKQLSSVKVEKEEDDGGGVASETDSTDFYDLTRDDDDDEEEEESEEEEEEENDDDEKRQSQSASKYKNSEAADSYRHLRSFVVRGPNIGVFKRGDKPEYFDTLEDIRSKEDKAPFVPTGIMLYNHDSNLLCLRQDPNDDKSNIVYNINLERGEVVDEWTAGEFTSVLKMSPLDKYAPRTGEVVFTGMNSNALFAIDPRLSSKDKAVDVQKYTYATNPRFTSMGTSSDGSLAVGNAKGEIRFYSGTPGWYKRTKSGVNPKTAKVALSGLGERIKHIDVSLDSHWVLATCDSYLMLIDSSLPNGSNCFQGRASAENKPTPTLLRLNPHDLRTVGKACFNPARFNVGSDGETWIVTSTGPYLVAWNFAQVKKGNLFAYTMKKERDERVVDSQFAAVARDAVSTEAPILVVTPDDLLLERLKKTDKSPYSQRRRTYQ